MYKKFVQQIAEVLEGGKMSRKRDQIRFLLLLLDIIY